MAGKFTEHEVTLKVRHYQDTLFFRVEAGKGNVGGHDLELANNVSGGAPIVRFPKDDPMGAWTLAWADLVIAIFPLAFPGKKKESDGL